jgi:hypothetical protein
MPCSQCQTVEVKISNEIGDAGDIERTICANEDCGAILKEEVIVDRGDGTKLKRPRPVKLEDQPENFQFNGVQGAIPDDLLSADQMLQLAINTREETVGKEAREIAKTILMACAEVVLEGEHIHIIEEEDSPSGEVIRLAVKELTDRGYKVKKTPKPGEGTELQVKWPTKQKPHRRKKKSKADAPDVPQTPAASKGQNPGQIQRQRQAALARKKALKER